MMFGADTTMSSSAHYDLAKFGGDTVVDIMRTHPMIIIGGILQRNPFFVPPEEFLREIRGRSSLTAKSW